MTKEDIRIALVNIYIGKLPDWIDLYVESCKRNSGVDWLIFADNPPAENRADNVKFIYTNMEKINSLFSDRRNLKINIKKPYKLCDFRPAFGVIFSDFLKEYAFWGFTDLDILYGDIKKFLTNDILQDYDVISADEKRLCGPFTILRNCDYINQLYKINGTYEEIFKKDVDYMGFDERGFNTIVKNEAENGRLKYLFRDLQKWRQGYLLPTSWKNGKVTIMLNSEVMFIHFNIFSMNSEVKRLGSAIDEVFYVGKRLYVLQNRQCWKNFIIKGWWYMYYYFKYIFGIRKNISSLSSLYRFPN